METILIVGLSVLAMFALLTITAVTMWLINWGKSAIGFGSRPDASSYSGRNRNIPGKKSDRFD